MIPFIHRGCDFGPLAGPCEALCMGFKCAPAVIQIYIAVLVIVLAVDYLTLCYRLIRFGLTGWR